MTRLRAVSAQRIAHALIPTLRPQPRRRRLYAKITVLAHSAAAAILMGSVTGSHRITAFTLSIDNPEPILMNADVLASQNNSTTAEATNADTRLSEQITNRTGIQPWEEAQRFTVNKIFTAPLTFYKLWAHNEGPTGATIFAWIDIEQL